MFTAHLSTGLLISARNLLWSFGSALTPEEVQREVDNNSQGST